MIETVTTVEPTSEPLTLADAKEQLRVIDDADDAYIEALISVARKYIEQTEGVSLASQTFRTTMEEFPDCDDEDYETLELPRSPATSITSIQYLDTSGTLQTLSSSLYSLDTLGSNSRVVLNYGQTWPMTRDIPGAVRITYVAGYSTVPTPYMHALKLLVSHWYEAREPIITGTIVAETPFALKALLASMSRGIYR